MCPNNHFMKRSFEDDTWNSAGLLLFFFLYSVLHVAMISILQRPGDFSHIWLETLKNSMHRYNQNLFRAQRVHRQGNNPTWTWRDRTRFSLQYLLFFYKGEGSSVAEPLQDSGQFWTVVLLSLLLLHIPSSSTLQKDTRIWVLCPGSSPCAWLYSGEHWLESRNPPSVVPRSHPRDTE